MKKALSVFLPFVMLLGLLASCGNAKKGPTFDSVYDPENDFLIALNDDKSRVDKQYGEPTEDAMNGFYLYLDAKLYVAYEQNKVVFIGTLPDSAFQFASFSPEKTPDDAEGGFIKDSPSDGSGWTRYFDENGKSTTKDKAYSKMMATPQPDGETFTYILARNVASRFFW